MKNKLNKQTTETRENAGEQVTICFNFAFDWLIEWREFSEPNQRAMYIPDYFTHAVKNCFNTRLH